MANKMKTVMTIECYECDGTIEIAKSSVQLPIREDQLKAIIDRKVQLSKWVKQAENAYLCPNCQYNPNMKLRIFASDLKGAINEAIMEGEIEKDIFYRKILARVFEIQ